METHLYRDLGWLPRPPHDFTALCRILAEPGTDSTVARDGTRLRALASCALDENQLVRLAKTIKALRANGASLAPLTPFRLGIASNTTTDFLPAALTATAARHGIALECYAGQYDQALQESVQGDSALHRFAPDAVLIALDWRGLFRKTPLGSREALRDAIAGAIEHFDAIRRGIRKHDRSICIVQNLAPVPENVLGSFEPLLAGTPRSFIDGVNSALQESIPGSGDALLDVAALAETVGLAEWNNPGQWHLAKLAFSQSYLPLYAERVCRVVGALLGKSRRCLVLDLDNTVWGGVIGDDGVEGIQVAQGDAAGEAFLNFQRYALALRARGVVLAVSSKNQDETARRPFREHPDMILREEHFAIFQANWNDKATNIQAIADELSLGLESLVLVDDNPAERALVRQNLPTVAVPEMPADPALFARTLSAAGYFEAVTFSAEDLQRAGYYEGNARRAALGKQVGDVESHLESLGMEITFQPFDALGRARIAQLIGKSNQFNLTTRRYTETEIAALEKDETCFAMQVRLADVFGDNGMISVVICRPAEIGQWEFDLWLMSCRVLGRRVEHMVLREVLEHARRREIHRLIGVYRPTDRNKLVEDHYAKLGFTLVRRDADGVTVWKLDVASAQVPGAPMKIRSEPFGATRVPAEVAAEVPARSAETS